MISPSDLVINNEYQILEKLGNTYSPPPLPPLPSRSPLSSPPSHPVPSPLPPSHPPPGEGSYGSVYKAVSKKTGKIVALKRVEKTGELDGLLKEISILEKCHSDYIVKYYGSHFEDSVLWLIIEYCAAGSVIDLIRITKTQLTETQIAVVLYYALKGIEYLHENKKIHRDIKAGNILLDDQGFGKLADFGVSAELLHTWADKDTFIGSPFWMSPEIISKSKYNKKTDIWSLGITAIELAEGVPPYSHIHPMRALFAIKANPPQGLTTPAYWSQDFNDFVRKCLNVDPKARPNAKDLLNHNFIVQKAKNKAVLSDLVAVSLDAIEKARSNGIFDQVKKEGSLTENNTFIAYTDTVVRKEDHPDPLWSNSNSEMFYGNHGGTVIEQTPGTFVTKDDEKCKLPDFVMQQITRMSDEPSSSSPPPPSFLPPSSSFSPPPSSIVSPPPSYLLTPSSSVLPPSSSIQPSSAFSPPPSSLLLCTEGELMVLDLDGLQLKKKKLEKEFQIEITNLQERYAKAFAGIDKIIEIKKKKRESGGGLPNNQNNFNKNAEISARMNEINPKLTESNQKFTENFERVTETNPKFTEISSRFTENNSKYTEISSRITENNYKFTDNPPFSHDRAAKTQQDFHSSNVMGEQTLPRKEGQRSMLKSQNREGGKSPNFGRGEKQEGNKMDFSFKNAEHLPPRTPDLNRKNELYSRIDKNDNLFGKVNENQAKQERNEKTEKIEKKENFQNIYKNEIKNENFTEFPFGFGKMTPNQNNSNKLFNFDDAKKSMGLLSRHTPNTENPAFQPGKIPFYMGGDPNKEKKLNGGGLATGYYQNYQRNMMIEKNDREVTKSKSQNKLV